ncbi:MAG: hypothetical protein FD145_840 [Candidatus Saganbacteria bacterium]|uniref:DUF4013 domain-containing protein n=1 Tax=Candidatus Saganbacteria bacterium TaxID=2575572 RepID=A0A833P368_UNCSA|nr:MAG: hypothetical protein FD145_840 [Candidatus Saganbacteria bacterium]
MDIVKSFTDSWNIYLKNFILIVLAGIVAAIFGFLIAPMVGFYMIFVKAQRGEQVSFNDVFAPFKKYLALLIASLWIFILIAAATLPAVICYYFNLNVLGVLFTVISIMLIIYLGVCWMFSLILVYDKDLPVMNALNTSRELVLKNNFWMHLLLLLLAGIVCGLGNIIFGIGIILTFPIALGAIACTYAEESK